MALGVLNFLPQAGGIDERPKVLVQLHQLVDRVDGGAGDVVHDRAIGLGQLVQQAGLAHVRAAHKCNTSRALSDRRGSTRNLGEVAQDLIEHVGTAAAVQRRDRPRIAKTQRIELGDLAPLTVGLKLVCNEDDRHLSALQVAGHHHVCLGHGGLCVDNHDDDVRGLHGCLGLARDRGVDALCVRVPATGVLHPETTSVPLRHVAHTVAGHAGMVLHNCFTTTQEPVYQRRLTHIRAAHDRHRRQRFLYHVRADDAVFGFDFGPFFVGVVVGLVASIGIVAEVGLAELRLIEVLEVVVVLSVVRIDLIGFKVVVARGIDAGLDELSLRLETVFNVLLVAHRALLSTTAVSAASTSSGVISDVSTISASSAGRSGLVLRDESASSRRFTSANTASKSTSRPAATS